MNIVWLKTAIDNRFAQLDYVAQKNPKGAVRLDSEIERQIDRLAIYPEMGRIGRVDGTRELVIVRTPYIAIYRVARYRVEILRLLHGAEQWPIPLTETGEL